MINSFKYLLLMTLILQTFKYLPVDGKNTFTIVLDAGSTGSRVHVYTFKKSQNSFGGIQLVDEIFAQNRPGLSSFADNPSEGAKYIAKLLEEAKKGIPKDQWGDVSVMLKATAGLRLLPEPKSNAILQEVRKELKKFPFKVGPDAVAMLDSTYEGVYGWLSVNFLKNKLNDKPQSMLAALDMGGGSTEIVFPTESRDRFPEKEIVTVELYSKSGSKPVEIQLYSHSYLGLGLNSAKMSILSTGNAKNSKNLSSVCIAPQKIGHFLHQGVNYTFHSALGAGQEKSTFSECKNIVKQFVNSMNVTNPKGILNLGKIAFSGFYWEALSAGLIDKTTGGNVSVNDFTQAAEKYCLKENGDQPFQCVDLLFISSLLIEGYHFTPGTNIEIVKTIKNREVSWTLGAALNELNLVKVNDASLLRPINVLFISQIVFYKIAKNLIL